MPTLFGDSVRMRCMLLALLVCGPILPQIPPARGVPDWMEAGPMIGHVGPTEANIWVRVAKGVKLNARATLGGATPCVARIKKLGDRVCLVTFKKLQADQEMVVQLYQGEHPGRGVAVMLRTAPEASQTGTVRIAIGSCLNDVLHQTLPVFPAIAKEKPDCFVFLGDNSYYVRTWKDANGKLRMASTGKEGDWTSEKKMFKRQITTRENVWLQSMLRVVPCYAVWDDHDYGPNNADRLFKNKKQALKVFKRMWANPDYGVKGTKGCFSSFRRGPVEVFLMDCRYHKYVSTKAHPKVPAKERTIWGEEQLEWLLKNLKRSDAPVKMIANGTQFLYQGKTGEGHFQEARHEYQAVLDYIHEHRIGGVVFLTGDRHHSELMHMKQEGRPALIDFTSSPLGQGQRVGPHNREQQPTTVWKMAGDSFGLISVEIARQGVGTITFEVRDARNTVPVLDGLPLKTSWKLGDLYYPQ